jgi:hypothetical protein
LVAFSTAFWWNFKTIVFTWWVLIRELETFVLVGLKFSLSRQLSCESSTIHLRPHHTMYTSAYLFLSEIGMAIHYSYESSINCHYVAM